ncbi:MAG: SRPBCC domain-containing protein, partial [Polaromonas sp.]
TNAEVAATTLVVRRTIRATPERLFAAWTTPDQLRNWWGPAPVTCSDAEVDLRVGGQYRLANQMPNGEIVWILGKFEVIEPPHKLVYSWQLGTQAMAESERVTVTFETRQDATEVTVVHERIPDKATRDQHEQGWCGCFNGLADYLRNS